MHSFWSRLSVVVVGLSLLGIFNLHLATGSSTGGLSSMQTEGVSLSSPLQCPSSGCATGQTLTMLASYQFSGLSTVTPNLKVCVYMPNAWAVDASTFSIDSTGQPSGLTYDTDPNNCQETSSPSTSYSLIAARQTAVTGTTNQDSLRLSFRIPWSVTATSGAVKVRVLTLGTDGTWAMKELTSNSVPLVPLNDVLASTGHTLFVAADPGTCGDRKPCYVNSGQDDTGGTGTGLKDAVDAIPSGLTDAEIDVLGSYTVKTNTVVVNRPVTITSASSGYATITYNLTASDTNCSQPILSLREAVTLSKLFINDGTCTSKNRTLIDIAPDPALAVTLNILSNSLLNGQDAIYIHDVKAQVNVLYNNVSDNSGYSLYWNGSTNKGGLRLIANNMVAGGSSQINCAGGDTSGVQANRLINHNYWGTYSPDSTSTHCTTTLSKRLGAPILKRADTPGVFATRVTVTDKTPTRQNTPVLATEVATATLVPFYGQLSFSRSGDGSADFPMYIVDHGNSVSSGMPFAGSAVRAPLPCSNAYDFFLPDDITPTSSPLNNTTLNLSFYYDTGSAECQAMIAASSVCRNQTPTPDSVPFLWYNPTAMPTAWSSVMQGVGSDVGQPVTCDTTTKSLRVAIDPTGRPNLTGDMNFTPLLIGSPIFKVFTVLAYDREIKLHWETIVEPDIVNFTVQKGNSASSLGDVGNPIDALGGDTTGYSYYNYTDTNLTNGVIYYYRLKIKRSDGQYLYTEVHSLAANVPTIAPPPTSTPVTPTWTPTFTLVPINNPTRALSKTPTYGPGTPSPTPFMLYTLTPIFGLSGTPGMVSTVTQTPEPSLTPTITQTLLPEMETGTAIAMVNNATATPTRRPTRTATPGGVVAGASTGGSPTWLSLLLGLLAGAAVAAGAGGAWWYYRNRP